MPALPPIAILGAWVVDRVAMSDRLFRVLKVPRSAWKSLVVAGLLLPPVLAFGIGPAAANFRNPAAVGGPPGPGPPEGIPVTTDQLTAAPQDYDGRFVRLDGPGGGAAPPPCAPGHGPPPRGAPGLGGEVRGARGPGRRAAPAPRTGRPSSRLIGHRGGPPVQLA